MDSKQIAVIGADCEAQGHPSSCQEPAPGNLEEVGGEKGVSINGVAVATHGDSMHYPTHAHDYSSEEGCHAISSHDLTPDQEPGVTVNGEPIVRNGDTTTDPGSGGTAEVINSGGNTGVTHST